MILVYERVSSNWKGNVGNSILTEVEVKKYQKEWIKWIDEAMKQKIGCELDIFTLDAISVEVEDPKTQKKQLREYLLEINDSASGLAPENMDADLKDIRDLVISKIK